MSNSDESDIFETIQAPSEGLYKEKGSKFIAYAFPVSTEDDIKDAVGILKKEHHSARHHCYAYRLGYDKKVFRTNDDGEPSNSAGKPILGQILSNDLTDILIVVVRYFGGIKLGVGGLITAYKAAAADAIENADIISKQAEDTVTVQFEYPMMNSVMKIVKDLDLEITEQVFELDCMVKVQVRKTLASQVISRMSDIEGARVND